MYLLIACLVGFTVFAAGSSDTPEAPLDSDLDRLLQGARVGLSFDMFIQAHPEAVYSDIDKRNLPVSADAPDALLITSDNDAFLGLDVSANFGFKEQRLYEMVVIWSDIPEIVESRLRRFFMAVIQRHGSDYTKKTMLVHPDAPEERPVAVFFWDGSDAVTLAFHTPAASRDASPRDVLSYAQFAPDDPILNDIFEGNAATKDQQSMAWRQIDNLRHRIEADLAEPGH